MLLHSLRRRSARSGNRGVTSAGTLHCDKGITSPTTVPSARRLRFRRYIPVAGSGWARLADEADVVDCWGMMSNRCTYARNESSPAGGRDDRGGTKRMIRRSWAGVCPSGHK